MTVTTIATEYVVISFSKTLNLVVVVKVAYVVVGEAPLHGIPKRVGSRMRRPGNNAVEATESLAGDLDCVLLLLLNTSSNHLNHLALVGG